MGPTKKPVDAASRQERKAKKRKLEDAVPDLPGDNDGANEDGGVPVDAGVEDERSVKRAKKEGKNTKGEKKSKSEEKPAAATADNDVDQGDEVTEGGDDAPRKSKKERKAERKAKEAAEKAAGGTASSTGPTSTTTTPSKKDDGAKPDEKAESKASKAQGKDGVPNKNNNRNRDKKRAEKAAQKAANGDAKDARFIVFVGNLPFTANTASITKHFASVKPKSIRHLTKKEDPTKSKGCAFVEFDGYDHMKTALQMFHHSNFDDGQSPARKINVELTAGGGGNTQDRRKKIEQKNTKLNDERLRRIQEEEKAKWAKKKEGAADENGVHPSRRARIPGK